MSAKLFQTPSITNSPPPPTVMRPQMCTAPIGIKNTCGMKMKRPKIKKRHNLTKRKHASDINFIFVGVLATPKDALTPLSLH